MIMSNANGEKKTALVIEDEEQSAYLLEFMLRRDGFDVVRAADGRESVAMITEGPVVDIVVMDIMLPYLDGFELIALMRAHPKWREVPIIVLSGRTKESDVVRALEAGADDFVRKPYQPSELLARIKSRLAMAGQRNVA